MRLQTLYFIGTLAVAAIPLSAGAQSLPANDQWATEQWTTNAQADNRAVQQCAPGWVWEHGGYTGGGTWRPPHCALLNGTIAF
jgi:hypothetical protein